MNRAYYDEGVHLGEVLQQGLTEAKTGTAQFVLKVKILGATEASDPMDEFAPHGQQYERTIYMPLTDKTVEFVVPQLQTLGFTGKSLGQLDPSHPSHQSLVGVRAKLWCGHKPDQSGDIREKWSISRESAPVTPLEPKKLRQLDALFGKALQGGAKLTPQPSSRVAVADQGITDDDLPF